MQLFKMERELGIPLIATNDAHYVGADDSRAHEILLCVQTAGSMNDPKRFKFDTQEFYIKSRGGDAANIRAELLRFARGRCSLWIDAT